MTWPRFDHVTKQVGIVLIGIAMLLVMVSILIRVIHLISPRKDFSELQQKTQTWWVIAWLFGLAILLSAKTSIAFLCFVSFLAFKEYLTLIPMRRADRRVLFWAYLSIPLQYLWVYLGWHQTFLVFIPVYMFLFLPARMVLIGRTEGFLQAIGTINWGLMTTVFSLSHAAALLTIKVSETSNVTPRWPDEMLTNTPGVGLLVLLILLTEINDIAQFCWGKAFGRVRVAP